MSALACFELICLLLLFAVFVMFGITTHKIIKEKEKEIIELKSTLKRKERLIEMMRENNDIRYGN